MQPIPSSAPQPSGQGRGNLERGAHTLRVQRGTVVGIDGRDVFVDLGPRQQGVIARSRFGEDPPLGTSLEFTLRGQEQGLWVLELAQSMPSLRWETIQVGEVVEARALAVNPGGLELKVDGLHGFMPKGECGLSRREDARLLLGQRLLCEVLEVDLARQRVLLSRKRVLRAEAESKKRRTALALRPGAVLPGRIVRLESFGAIVRLDGDVEGLLHISNIDREQIEHPSERLTEGQRLEVVVLAIRQGGRRICLGLKQLEPSPWKAFALRYPVGSLIAAEVQRIVPFGAFVHLLEPLEGEWLVSAVQGLVHRSECALPEDVHPRQALPRGTRLCLRVLAVDPERERLSLSRLDPSGRVLDWRQTEEIPERIERDQAARRALADRTRPEASAAPHPAALIDGSAAFQRADAWRLRLLAALQPLQQTPLPERPARPASG